jgi:hypothetical protein
MVGVSRVRAGTGSGGSVVHVRLMRIRVRRRLVRGTVRSSVTAVVPVILRIVGAAHVRSRIVPHLRFATIGEAPSNTA